MADSTPEAYAIEYLLSARAVRERSLQLYQYVERGDSHYFSLHLEQLAKVVDLVVREIHKNYPDLHVPYHSRWRHFGVGGIDREAVLNHLLAHRSRREAVMAKVELAIVSVLLDAGAGMTWRYTEPELGQTYSRSEGLAVASFHGFTEGVFGSEPLTVDARTLAGFSDSALMKLFQVSDTNPLAGISGRTALLNNLGSMIESGAEYFPGPSRRLGNIINYLIPHEGVSVTGPALLTGILRALGSIWPGRLSLGGTPLGDVWRHHAITASDLTVGLIPFHKLSQWLTYSLCEPLQMLCGKIDGVERLTGLAEYRNGGLLIDSGLVALRNPADAAVSHAPHSELVIEWRALTVIFLDMIAEGVRAALGVSEAEFPLAKVLQGGTWSVGRFLAQEKRQDGGPPITIQSDGTVF